MLFQLRVGAAEQQPEQPEPEQHHSGPSPGISMQANLTLVQQAESVVDLLAGFKYVAQQGTTSL